MLTHLNIQNYALIKNLSMDFDSGFSVITGETGAGKSILLGALSLILGQRADTQTLMDKEKKCVIEGTFDIKNLDLKSIFDTENLDYENPLILRREIATNGKSRAFVNDTPVNLNVLKTLGERLVDIHSQHETLTLNESNFRLNLVDALLEKPVLLDACRYTYREYKKVSEELKHLVEVDNKLKADQDYFRFLFSELDELHLVDGEQETMEQNLEVMNHAKEIKRNLLQSSETLNGGEENVLLALQLVDVNLKKIAKISPNLEEISNRIHSTIVELKDIDSELNSISDTVHFDPEKQTLWTERLDKIYRLQTKHHVKTVAELLHIQNDLSSKLLDISTNSEKIEKLQSLLNGLIDDLTNKAENLTLARKKSAQHIEQQVQQTLSQLGMKDARLELQFSQTPDFIEYGRDHIKFMFSANLGSELRELSKVASGGELSRLMLAIKSVINQQNILPTIIFDEIDTGVSGDIAGKVAKIMQQMSTSMQVIAITHLPQMAAKSKVHYRVYKRLDNQQTISEIKSLNTDEHIHAIASMISNETVTDSAISAAKELINDAQH
ncbi:MAG: DNA repair protein RecN [Bacteroidales bacterium]|jgi:DNA repair protein RecN (Recombination protein N)|nr:DNA repair protein RecN [Bacteroidales bacterium]